MTMTLPDPAAVLGHLPLSEPVFHILLSLADESRHGYGILIEVERRTEGTMHLGIGTLYSAIKRLRERKLMEEVDPPDGAEEDPRRRYYRLSLLGKAVMAAEARRLETLVHQARAKAVLPAVDPSPVR